jgi:hypothetical protein
MMLVVLLLISVQVALPPHTASISSMVSSRSSLFSLVIVSLPLSWGEDHPPPVVTEVQEEPTGTVTADTLDRSSHPPAPIRDQLVGAIQGASKIRTIRRITDVRLGTDCRHSKPNGTKALMATLRSVRSASANSPADLRTICHDN